MSSPTLSPPPAFRSAGERAWRGVETGTPNAHVCAELARTADADPLAIRALILTDRLDDARSQLEDLREQHPAGLTASRLAAELALRAGALDEAEREARRGGATRLLSAILLARGARDAVRVGHTSAELHLALGAFGRAIALAREDGWRRTAAGQTNPARAPWRATLAVALARSGRTEEAIAIADDGLTLAREFGAPTAFATALLARAIVEPDLEARADHAAAALAVPTPAPLLHAEAQIELGATLIQLGCSAEAREPLGHALETAEDAGAEPLAERAARTLARTALRVVA
ncbi:hypothetical protein OJ998_26195 [Solirubrobacter taibaiensis]|nr:hypothetical protein [Solirubrobacter taibaiensis]